MLGIWQTFCEYGAKSSWDPHWARPSHGVRNPCGTGPGKTQGKSSGNENPTSTHRFKAKKIMGQTAETAESIGIIVWTVRPFLSYRMNDLKIQHCTFAFQYFLVFLIFCFYRRMSDLSFVEIRRNPAFEKRAHFRTCENRPDRRFPAILFLRPGQRPFCPSRRQLHPTCASAAFCRTISGF